MFSYSKAKFFDQKIISILPTVASAAAEEASRLRSSLVLPSGARRSFPWRCGHFGSLKARVGFRCLSWRVWSLGLGISGEWFDFKELYYLYLFTWGVQVFELFEGVSEFVWWCPKDVFRSMEESPYGFAPPGISPKSFRGHSRKVLGLYEHSK